MGCPDFSEADAMRGGIILDGHEVHKAGTKIKEDINKISKQSNNDRQPQNVGLLVLF